MKNVKILTWISILIVSIYFGFSNDVLKRKSDIYDHYSIDGNIENPKEFNDFYFKNSSSLIQVKSFSKKRFNTFDPAQTIIGDLNNDSYDDFILINSSTKYQKNVQIFISKNGLFYPSMKLNDYLNDFFKLTSAQTAAIVDLNNDGSNDLVFSLKNGCIKVFSGNKDNRFVPTNYSFCSKGDKRNISLIDYNNDGLVDLYFTSFFNTKNYKSLALTSNGSEGGENVLLKNINGFFLKDVTSELNIQDLGYSWTSAIADFNQDGFQDILVMNDYGRNNFFLNKRGTHFELNNQALPNKNVSFSMSSEVLDINNDGLFDIYISNAIRPNLKSGNNQLLISKINKSTNSFYFEDIAKKYSFDSCGWSWGTKSFDPFRNGNLALFIVNSPNPATNPIERQFFYNSSLKIREFFSQFILDSDYPKYFDSRNINQQKNCIYYYDGSKAHNLAEVFKVNDVEGGRSIASFDFDNDGNNDFLINNIQHSPILYNGKYVGKNGWIGFKLIGTRSNRNAIGAKIVIETNLNIYTKSNYPTNGYQSQSSLKILFGIKKDEIIKSITIVWPNNLSQKVLKFNNDSYNIIYEN